MKKLEFGQAVTIIANLGVIAGILFLGFELHQNNEQLSAQARYNYYHERIEAQRLIAGDPGLAEITQKMMAGAELAPAEQVRLEFLARSIFITIEYEFIELQLGRITLEEFNLRGKRRTFGLLRDSWDIYRQEASEQYVEFVETQIL